MREGNVFTSMSAADPGFPRGGAPTYDFAKFSQKLHEIEGILTPGGASPPAPLRSATVCVIPSVQGMGGGGLHPAGSALDGLHPGVFA